jgi:hypothetical protein
MTILIDRDPEELNKNRKGPIRQVLAIVDVDKEGNANILKAVTCSEGCTRPLLAVEESGFSAIEEAYEVLRRSSKRRLMLVRFSMIEVLRS